MALCSQARLVLPESEDARLLLKGDVNPSKCCQHLHELLPRVGVHSSIALAESPCAKLPPWPGGCRGISTAQEPGLLSLCSPSPPHGPGVAAGDRAAGVAGTGPGLGLWSAPWGHGRFPPCTHISVRRGRALLGAGPQELLWLVRAAGAIQRNLLGLRTANLPVHGDLLASPPEATCTPRARAQPTKLLVQHLAAVRHRCQNHSPAAQGRP